MSEALGYGYDYFSTTDLSEYNQFRAGALGQMFYIPATPDNSRANTALYRLFSQSPYDHMDSIDPNEASGLGYSSEGVLGYPYTTASALPGGLVAINRFYNGVDHLSGFPTLNPPGYQNYGTQGIFGFMRYLADNPQMQTYSGGAITETSDIIAGGAISSWKLNGVEFINTYDYGRYMQSAFFFPNEPGNIGQQGFNTGYYNYNPTEAGDQAVGLNNQHGSPAVFSQVAPDFHKTLAAPLEYSYNTQRYNGNALAPTQLVMYPTTRIGKKLELNSHNISQLARYTAIVSLPVSLTINDGEMPTAYLKSNFNTFYHFDAAATPQFTSGPLTSTIDTCSGHPPDSTHASEDKFVPTFVNSVAHAGVIISDSTGSNAMGVYAVLPEVTDPALVKSGFVLDNFLSCPPDGDEGPTSKWSVRTGTRTLPANQEVLFTSYIITGTVQYVMDTMLTIYANDWN